MNATSSVLVALLGALGMALVLRAFYRHQNQGKIGGSISLPKAYWLGLVVYCWYILGSIFLFLGPKLAFHTTFLVTSLSVWFRAPIELAMLFHYKNWLPKYGIAHNWMLLITVPLGAALHLAHGAQPGLLDLACLLVWTMSAAMELYHSIAFSKIVGTKTMGDSAIWFASGQDPAFDRINRITTRNNVLLSATTMLTLYLMATR